jgi:hypothetical protein
LRLRKAIVQEEADAEPDGSVRRWVQSNVLGEAESANAVVRSAADGRGVAPRFVAIGVVRATALRWRSHSH